MDRIYRILWKGEPRHAVERDGSLRLVAGDLFGRARLAELLVKMPWTLSAGERVNAVREEVRKYAAGAEMADDVTILVVRWHGNR